jgi:hypothetical protein
MWYPIDTAKGQLINGVWEIDFGGYVQDRVIEFIVIQGPPSSVCSIYLDTIFMDTTSRGDFNRAEYINGIPMSSGRQLRLVWNVATGSVLASVGMSDGNARIDAQVF